MVSEKLETPRALSSTRWLVSVDRKPTVPGLTDGSVTSRRTSGPVETGYDELIPNLLLWLWGPLYLRTSLTTINYALMSFSPE